MGRFLPLNPADRLVGHVVVEDIAFFRRSQAALQACGCAKAECSIGSFRLRKSHKKTRLLWSATDQTGQPGWKTSLPGVLSALPIQAVP